MLIIAIKHVPYGNQIECTNILAHSIDEAERYLRLLMERQYQNKDLSILHSYQVGEPSTFSISSKDENGNPTTLTWNNKEKTNGGFVKYWTELPLSIKKKLPKVSA
ncbi:MAG: hypothetical protein M1300_07550 [Epsilonproteobacteria bacterium]|nr:hypothetical protein [Campylobacterota bacterium]